MYQVHIKTPLHKAADFLLPLSYQKIDQDAQWFPKPRNPCSCVSRNGHCGVSNHQPHHCLLNRLFGCNSKKASKLRVTGLCVGNSPHKWPVTRKIIPFDDVIMCLCLPWINETVDETQQVAQRRRSEGRAIVTVPEGMPWSPNGGGTLGHINAC